MSVVFYNFRSSVIPYAIKFRTYYIIITFLLLNIKLSRAQCWWRFLYTFVFATVRGRKSFIIQLLAKILLDLVYEENAQKGICWLTYT